MASIPGKRGPKSPEIQVRFQQLLEDVNAFQRIRKIMCQTKMRPDMFLRYVELVLDRGFGKAAQSVTHKGDADNPVNIKLVQYGTNDSP